MYNKPVDLMETITGVFAATASKRTYSNTPVIQSNYYFTREEGKYKIIADFIIVTLKRKEDQINKTANSTTSWWRFNYTSARSEKSAWLVLRLSVSQ